mgnify:CR=1 FL=1
MFASYCKLQRDNIAKILACSQGFTRKFSIFFASFIQGGQVVL